MLETFHKISKQVTLTLQFKNIPPPPPFCMSELTSNPTSSQNCHNVMLRNRELDLAPASHQVTDNNKPQVP